MLRSLLNFISPPELADYEETQKAQLLHFMLSAALLGGSITGVASLSKEWETEAALQFLLAIVCLVGFLLNRLHYFTAAGVILCGTLFLVISSLLFYGVGLFDSTIVAFPIFILCATFLFRRRGLIVATLLTILALATIYILGVYGVHESIYPATLFRAIILSLLFAIMAVVIWVIRDVWQSNLEQLRKSYDLTLEGWAKAVEYRDGETAGHSRRVTDLSVSLARRLGLNEKQILNIRRGAYLHDIGKLAIPDEILLKPGPLTEEEIRIMRRHPGLARDFISEIPFLRTALSIPYSHHERWDGNGYPDGLAGDAIPLSARIFTVVDQWDALTSNRPYRKAWEKDKAIAYLQANAGIIFDQNIVEVFLRMLRENPGL